MTFLFISSMISKPNPKDSAPALIMQSSSLMDEYYAPWEPPNTRLRATRYADGSHPFFRAIRTGEPPYCPCTMDLWGIYHLSHWKDVVSWQPRKKFSYVSRTVTASGVLRHLLRCHGIRYPGLLQPTWPRSWRLQMYPDYPDWPARFSMVNMNYLNWLELTWFAFMRFGTLNNLLKHLKLTAWQRWETWARCERHSLQRHKIKLPFAMGSFFLCF